MKQWFLKISLSLIISIVAGLFVLIKLLPRKVGFSVFGKNGSNSIESFSGIGFELILSGVVSLIIFFVCLWVMSKYKKLE